MIVIDQYGVTHVSQSPYHELLCGKSNRQQRATDTQLEAITCQACQPLVCRDTSGIVHRVNQVPLAVPFVSRITALCDIRLDSPTHERKTAVTCLVCLTDEEDEMAWSVQVYAEATGATYGEAWKALGISEHLLNRQLMHTRKQRTR